MKRTFCTFFTFLLIFALSCTSFASGFDLPSDNVLTAQSAYFINVDTGDVAIDINGTQQRDIASLTKIMTALLLIENVSDLDGTIYTAPTSVYVDPVTSSDASTADIYPNEQVSARTLLYAILLPSGNEAAAIAAYHLGGESLDNFYAMMNKRAAELGCTNTNFTNPHGLGGMDEGYYSSARDLALIATECWKHDVFREVVGSVSYDMPISNIHTTPQDPEFPDVAYTIYNTNYMLRETSAVYEEYIKGMKTGSTYSAGRTLASVAVNDRGETYIGIVLGSPWDPAPDGYAFSFHDTAYLYDWIFANFSVQSPVDITRSITEVSVRLSEDTDTLELVPSGGLEVLLPINGSDYYNTTQEKIDAISGDMTLEELNDTPPILPDTLMYNFDVPQSIDAPVKEGDIVGTLTVSLNGEILKKINLYAAESVDRSLILFLVDEAINFFDSTYFKVVLVLTGIYIVSLVAIVLTMRRKRSSPKKKKRKKYAAGDDDDDEMFGMQDELLPVGTGSRDYAKDDWTKLVEVDKLAPNSKFAKTNKTSRLNKTIKK